MQGSILDHVGRTPLVPLRRLNLGLRPAISLKVESLNPGGSIKDRVGMAMIEEAERQRLAPARRNDHRGDRGEYRRRAGHGGRGQGIPLHLRAARQDER